MRGTTYYCSNPCCAMFNITDNYYNKSDVLDSSKESSDTICFALPIFAIRNEYSCNIHAWRSLLILHSEAVDLFLAR